MLSNFRTDTRYGCRNAVLGKIPLDITDWPLYRVSTMDDNVRWRLTMVDAKKVPKWDPSPAEVPENSDAEELARLAWAVAHPARVRIVRMLVARQSCVCGEIVSGLPLAQSTVSQHLKILKQSGLVQGDVDGPKVCYCIDADRLERLQVLIGKL